MTDFSKYKNITVDNDTYGLVTKLQTKLKNDVKLTQQETKGGFDVSIKPWPPQRKIRIKIIKHHCQEISKEARFL